MKTSLKAGAALSDFAHLLGLGRPAGARAEDDDDKKDSDAAKAEETDDDEDGDDRKDSKKSKRAKAEDDDKKDDDADAAKAEDDDDKDGDDKKDSKKSKKAKADMDDDECDDEDDDYAKGQKAERARWAKVLKSPAAGGGRLAAACEMLATTGLKSSAIISTLNALPVASGGGLRDRMASVETPNIGAGSGGSGAGGGDFAAQMKAAVAKVRPE